MGQAEPQPRRYTVAEYQALEEQSPTRHEFFEGEVFAMAGADVSHNLLCLNMATAFRQALKGRPCKVVMEGVQLAVEAGRHYTYPDVMVSCDADDQRSRRAFAAPVLLVEVLSPSTAEYDRSRKFTQYQKLPSLQHYVLVSQATWLVEWFRREPGNLWSYTALYEAEDALVIPELNLRLTVADVYEDTGIAPLRLAEEPMAEYGSEPMT